MMFRNRNIGPTKFYAEAYFSYSKEIRFKDAPLYLLAYVVFDTHQRIASVNLADGPFSLFLGAKPINQAQHYKYLGMLSKRS